jgi:hypothetical protein
MQKKVLLSKTKQVGLEVNIEKKKHEILGGDADELLDFPFAFVYTNIIYLSSYNVPSFGKM